MLTCIGAKGRDIYDSFTFTTDGDNLKLDKVVEQFDGYCEPRKNTTMARYQFLTHKQATGQPFHEFVTELKNLSEDCEFGTIKESLVKDMIICGVNDSRLRERFLREDNIDLTKVIKIGQAAEQTKAHAHKLKESEKAVNQLKFPKETPESSNHTNVIKHNRNNMERVIKDCGFCGGVHNRGNCPAYGKECRNCMKRNHLAKVCRSRKVVKAIEKNDDPPEDDNDFFIDAITINDINSVKRGGDNGNVSVEVNLNTSAEWTQTLQVDNSFIDFKIDSGSQVDIIRYKDYLQLQPKPVLHKTGVTLNAYNNTQVPVHGKCRCVVVYGDIKVSTWFIVTDDNLSPILGLQSSEKLSLIKRSVNNIESADGIERRYQDCFGEIGCLSQEYHMELNPEVKPVVSASRRIPHSLKPKVKMELERMMRMNIIEPVDRPTDWVNALIVVEKPNGKLRLCLDPRPLNRAIKRHHFPMPTAEDIFSKMQDARVFTKLDASSGYWQIPVDEETSHILTFSTPFGRFRFNRMPYGIHSASEIFQKAVAEIIIGIENAANMQDDIIIWGSSQKEHDEVLIKVLDRIRESGLKLNKGKCVFSKSEVTFLGHVVSSSGIRLDPTKCSAITDMPTPTNKTELMRLLGMMNYIGKFIPNLSKVTAPLRLLLNNDIEFLIQKPQLDAIAELKRLVTSAPVLQFFNPNNPSRLKTDASSEGLGALIEQKFGEEWKPIGYASRSLNESEKQYAQIEKEILSIVYGCDKFHEYLYGYQFIIHNDHKPLSSILAKPIHKCPPRIQRFYLRLLKYDFSFEHKPGKQMAVSDALSRASLLETSESEIDAEDMAAYVHSITDKLPISEEKLRKMQIETNKDSTLQTLKEYTLNGWPSNNSVDPFVKPFHAFQDEISFHNGVLLKGDRMIIPTSLRTDMLKLIHQGHFGIEKCKQRARFSMYWPGLDEQIERLVSNCSTCLNHRNQQRREKMIPHEVPDASWVKVGTDLFVLNNRDYVIVIDYHSKFITVSYLRNKKSSTVIQELKKVFSVHGIPKKIFSDNGPEYTSREFKQFSSTWDFSHDTSSPEYPQSNGLVERAVQTVKRMMRKAEENGEDPYLGLLNLNDIPLGNGLSPAEMMFSRKTRTLLPSMQKTVIAPLSKPSVSQKVDPGAVNLKPIDDDTTVRIYSKDKSNWKKTGKVIGKSSQPRSYQVLNENGNVIRRNRRQLIPTNETFEPQIDYDAIFNAVNEAANDIDLTTEPVNDTGAVDKKCIVTKDESDEKSTPTSDIEVPYRRRLRSNIKKPDRYGYGSY